MTTPGAGTHEIGLYTEAEIYSDDGPLPILADYIDPATGEFLSLLQSHRVSDGLLVEAYRVERDSGEAVAEVGNTIRLVRDTDLAALAELRARALLPIKELERDGIFRLADFQMEADGDTVAVAIDVFDMTQADTREAVSRRFLIPRRVF